jgi:hypothetical protein
VATGLATLLIANSVVFGWENWKFKRILKSYGIQMLHLWIPFSFEGLSAFQLMIPTLKFVGF